MGRFMKVHQIENEKEKMIVTPEIDEFLEEKGFTRGTFNFAGEDEGWTHTYHGKKTNDDIYDVHITREWVQIRKSYHDGYFAERWTHEVRREHRKTLLAFIRLLDEAYDDIIL